MTEVDLKTVGSLAELTVLLSEGTIKPPVMFIYEDLLYRVSEDDFAGFLKGMKVACWITQPKFFE